jgi:deoxyribose-phosphate aldolase
MISAAELAARIDHSVLAPEATADQVRQAVDDAKRYGFAAVCVQGIYVAEVAEALAGTAARTCAVVGFPHGAMKPTVKAMEATVAAKDGAQEIDFVAHLPVLLAKDTATARWQWIELVRAVRSVNRQIVVKVIIESALLMQNVSADEAEARLAAACKAARESGCDFVKTSSGFHLAGGASVEAVRLMKKHAEGLRVKASGGIRTREQALAMLAAGADRLGCSASVQIVTSAAT